MARSPNRQAVFFELDGVLMERPQLNTLGEVPYYSDTLDALSHIDQRNFQIFIATNREDLAFGRLKEREFKKLCEKFCEDMSRQGIRLSKIYSCPYHPKGKAKFRKESIFRKPAPGMYKMAQQEFDLNLERCWVLGHNTTDILAGSRAGMGTILMSTGEGGKDGRFQVEPHVTANNMMEAVRFINEYEMSLKY
jgi:D-glycero-D-manno-heptose 1,7-bisphosphate phosphatase